MKVSKPLEVAYYVGAGAFLGYAVFGLYGYALLGAMTIAGLMFLLELRELLLSTRPLGEAYQGWRYRGEPFFKRLRLELKYRQQDPNICCCGSYIGQGGDICYHGGCRSQKEYVITESMKK